MELCTRNLFLLDKQWINNFIWRCWKRLRDSVRKKKTRNVEQRWLVPSPRQCRCPHGLECAALFGKKQHDGYPSSCLFTRPCTMRLFPVTSYKRPDEREKFCWYQRNEKENAGGLEQRQNWRVPEMFSAVVKTLVRVHRVKRRVLWRRLEF